MLFPWQPYRVEGRSVATRWATLEAFLGQPSNSLAQKRLRTLHQDHARGGVCNESSDKKRHHHLVFGPAIGRTGVLATLDIRASKQRVFEAADRQAVSSNRVSERA